MGGDAYNITLYQKKTNKKKDKEYFLEVGYYGTVEKLLHGLIRKEIRINISTAKDFMALLDEVKNIDTMIADFCKKFEKEIKAMEKEIKASKKKEEPAE
jgi:hypothetical protein